MTAGPTPHMRMAGAATPATQKTQPQHKDVMTTLRQQHDQTPALTGTVVLTCELHQEYPNTILPGIDGAIAPAPPRHGGQFLTPAVFSGMHVILDIGDAPGFRADASWEAAMTARLVCRAASVEVRGSNPFGIARVRSDLAKALADQKDSAGSAVRP